MPVLKSLAFVIAALAVRLALLVVSSVEPKRERPHG